MEDTEAIPIFIGILLIFSVTIIATIFFVFNRSKKNTSKALALSPKEACKLYARDLTEDNLLYSVSVNLKHYVRDITGETIATITYPRAQKTLCRVITIGTTRHECHIEKKMTHSKVHLYDSGTDPATSQPRLTFHPKVTSESYTKDETEYYTRRLLERQPNRGWPIFQEERIVGYIDALYPRLKAHAFIFQGIDNIPLVEQLFIIAMSDRQV